MKIKETFDKIVEEVTDTIKEPYTLVELELLHYKIGVLYENLYRIYITTNSNAIISDLYDLKETKEELYEYVSNLTDLSMMLINLATTLLESTNNDTSSKEL